MGRANLNRICLIGNLGRDPEMRRTNTGKPVASFSMATTNSWKDKATGEWHNDAQWHRIVCWNAIAHMSVRHLKKGSCVYVEGRLQTREWTDKDGVIRNIAEVIADNVQFLDGPRGSGDYEDGEETETEDGDVPF